MAYRGPWMPGEDDGGLSPGVSPARTYSARHEAVSNPWASASRDGWATTPGTHRSQRQRPSQRRARDYVKADPAASPQGLLRQTRQSSALQMSVESFLLSLPMGDDPNLAAVEARVAERLYEEEEARTMLQEKLRQWSEVAMELFAMISELRATRGTAASPNNDKPDPATLSAIKSAITSFVLEQQQQTLKYDRTGQQPGVVRSVAAPQPLLDGRENLLDTPTVHQHHQSKQQHPFSDSASMGAMSTPRGAPHSGPGIGHGEEQQVQEDKPAEVLQLKQEVSRLRAELARERAAGARSRQQQALTAADGSIGGALAPGRRSESPGRVPAGEALTSDHERALASTLMMQAALLPKASQVQPSQHEQQQPALVDALRAELEVARVAVAERGAQATAASEEAQRLRRALLDAEIELQQAAVVSEAARKQLTQTEEEVAALRTGNGRLASDLEAERGKTTAVVAIVRQQLSQALSDLELCRAEMAAKDAEVKDLGARLTTRTSELATATQQLAELRSAATGAQPQQSERERRVEQLGVELAATREELRRLQQVLAKPRPDVSAESADDGRCEWLSEPDVSETLRIRLERLQVALDECRRTLLDEQRPLRRQHEHASRENAQEPPLSPIRAADHLSGALREVEELRRQLAAALTAAVEEREAQTQEHLEEVRRLQDKLDEARAAADDNTAVLRQQLADANQAAAAMRSEAGKMRQQLEGAKETAAKRGREAELLSHKLDETEADLDAARQTQQELLDRLADAEAEVEARSQELDSLRGRLDQAQEAAQAAGQDAEALRSRLEALVAMDAAASKLAERAEEGRLKLEAEAEELRRRLKAAEENQTAEARRLDELAAKQSALEEERAQLVSSCGSLQREWGELKDEYDRLQLDRDELAGRYSGLEQDKEELKDQYGKLQQERKVLLHRCGTLLQERDELQEQYGKLQQERDELKEQYGKLQQERDELKGHYGTARQMRDELMVRYDTLQQERDDLKGQYEKLQHEWNELKGQYGMLQQVRDELMERYENLQRERDELKDQHGALQRAQDDLKDKYGTLQQVRDELMDLYDTLQQEYDEFKVQYDMLKRERDRLCDRYKSLEQERNELIDQHEFLQQERDELNKQFGKLQQERDGLRDQYSVLQQKSDELKDQYCKLEGNATALARANDTISGLRKQLETLQGDFQASMVRNARLTAELGTKQASLDQAVAEAARVADANDALMVRNEALVEESEELLRNSKALNANLEAAEDQLAELQGQVAELRLQREQLADAQVEMQRRLKEAQVAADTSSAEAASIRARLLDSQQLATAADQDLGELRRQLAETMVALETQVQEAEALRREKAELQAEVDSNGQRLGELHQRVVAAKQAVEERGRDLSELRQRLDEKQAEAEVSSRKLQELRGQLSSAVRAVEEREQIAEELRWQKAELQALVDAKDRAAEELRREYAAAVAVAEGASRDVAAASRMEVTELSQRLAVAKAELMEAREASTAANKEVAELSQRLKTAQDVADVVTRDSNKFCEQLREQLAKAQEEARLLGMESDRMREQFTASQEAVATLGREVKTLRQELAASQEGAAAGRKEVILLQRELARAREAAVAGSKEVGDLMLHLAEAQSEAAVAIRQADELYLQMDTAHVAVEAAAREADELRQRLAEGQQQQQQQQQLIDEQVRAYQLHPAKQVLAHQAQVLGEQALEQQARVGALQRQLAEVHSSLEALGGRSQGLVRENAGLRWQLEEAKRAERAAQEVVEQARQDGGSENAQLVDALEAERKSRVALEGLVSELQQQLDGARLRAAELRQRMATAEAARAEALAEAAAAAALRADNTSATSAHVAELERSLEQMRSREVRMSWTLEETVRQAAEQAATIETLQGEVRAYEQIQQDVVSGLQRMMKGEAPSPVRTASGGGGSNGHGCSGRDARRALGLTVDIGAGGSSSSRSVPPSPGHLRAALMVTRQRIMALEDYLTSKTELEDGTSLCVDGMQCEPGADLQSSASGLGPKAGHGEAAPRRSPIDQLANVEKRLEAAQTAMSQQESHVASLERELRQRRSAAGLGGATVGRGSEDAVSAAEPSGRNVGRSPAGRPASDDMSTLRYSFDEDLSVPMAPGSFDWAGASDELPAVVSSEGLSSETVRPGPCSLTSGQREAEKVEEEGGMQLEQLQQQLVELGAEVAGLQERLSQHQAEDEVGTPVALSQLHPSGGSSSLRRSGGYPPGSAVGPEAMRMGSLRILTDNKSDIADAPPARSLGNAFAAAAAMQSSLRDSTSSVTGRGRDGRGNLPGAQAEGSSKGLVEGLRAASTGPPSCRSSGDALLSSYPEASFSPPVQRYSRQSRSRPLAASLREDEAAAGFRQRFCSVPIETVNSRMAVVDSGRGGGHLAKALNVRHRYDVAESTSVAADDGVDGEGGGSEGVSDGRDDMGDGSVMQRMQRQKGRAGDQSHQPSTRASRSSVHEAVASATGGGSGGGSSYIMEEHDAEMAAAVITLGGAIEDQWKAETETRPAAGEAEVEAAAAASIARARTPSPASPVSSISALDKDLTDLRYDLRSKLKQLDNLLLSQRSRQTAGSPPITGRGGSARGTPRTTTASLPAPGSPGPGLWAQYMTAAAATLASGGPGGDALLEGSQHAASLMGVASAVSSRRSTPNSVRVSPRARPVMGGLRPLDGGTQAAAWMEGEGGGVVGVGGSGGLRLSPHPVYGDESLTQGPGSGPFFQPARRA